MTDKCACQDPGPDKLYILYAKIDDPRVIDLYHFGYSLVINLAPTRQPY